MERIAANGNHTIGGAPMRDDRGYLEHSCRHGVPLIIRAAGGVGIGNRHSGVGQDVVIQCLSRTTGGGETVSIGSILEC